MPLKVVPWTLLSLKTMRATNYTPEISESYIYAKFNEFLIIFDAIL